LQKSSARSLHRNPALVVAMNPTWLDIGATDMAQPPAGSARGAAVLLIADDLMKPALADRIAVIYEGQIAGVLPAAEATPEPSGVDDAPPGATRRTQARANGRCDGWPALTPTAA
jgi:simple sugar transport system ATP-binding protein